MSENKTLQELMQSSGGFHVNRSLSPASKEAQKMTVTSGLKCLELFENYDHAGLLARMFLASSLYLSTKRLLTWKAKATPANFLYFQLFPSTHTTEETASSLWATPNTMDALPPKSSQALLREATVTRPGRSQPANLRDQVSNGRLWPTPTAADQEGGTEQEVKANDQRFFRVNAKGVQWGVKLRDAVAHSPKQSSEDEKTAGSRPPLTGVLPTPTFSQFKGTGPMGSKSQEKRLKKGHLDASIQDLEGETGKLNPDWEEWLMGFPPGWTNLTFQGSWKSMTKNSGKTE
jgi:hypothetical protein